MSDERLQDDDGPIAGDSLSASLVFLGLAQVLQRSIGLGRNVLFCGLLTDQQLGRWSLTFNFFVLAAPLVVLGLPGSFGRYVEHYRQRGQLRSFVARISGVTLLATVLATILQLRYSGWFAQVIYGDASQANIVPLLAASLCCVIIFNLLAELFTAMRLVRFTAVLQLISSLGFAVVGTSLLYFKPQLESGLIIAYGVASLCAVVIGVGLLARCWPSMPTTETGLGHRSMWFKLVPFAGWMWATNLVGNLFDVADQFMLKHFSGLPAAAADGLIGQYYSSRVIPILLVALAGMIGSSLLPHLSYDWERGRRDLVRARLRLTVKLTALAFTAAAAGVLVIGPFMFDWLLGQKYSAGMAVLPGTLMYCVWFCITCIAISYLLCAEAAHLSSFAFLAGLIVNVVLNYTLAPLFGLTGVVVATGVANATALILVAWLCARRGMEWGRGTALLLLLPLSLGLGGVAAAAIVLLVGALCWWTRRLFDDSEVDLVCEVGNAAWVKVRWYWSGIRGSRGSSLEEAQC